MAEELRAGGRDDVVFVGTANGLEAQLVPKAGIEFIPLPSRGFDRARPLTLFIAAWTALASVFRGIGLIRELKPDVVAGFGGYVSLPIGLAAFVCRVPVVLHEQNSVPGLANRILGRWARRVAVTHPDSAARFPHPERVTVTGNPVRRAVLEASAAEGRRRLGISEDAVMLLVFGGSRGARHLNQATVGLYERLMQVPDLDVVHVTGAGEFERVRDALAEKSGPDASRYHRYDYIHDMGDVVAAADLVVARAGATSLAELTVLGRPCVLVPYPYATDDHQTGNARSVVEAGAAVLIPDAELDSPRFGDELIRLLRDEGARAKMAQASARLGRPDAGRAVADVVRATANNRAGTDAASVNATSDERTSIS